MEYLKRYYLVWKTISHRFRRVLPLKRFHAFLKRGRRDDGAGRFIEFLLPAPLSFAGDAHLILK